MTNEIKLQCFKIASQSSVVDPEFEWGSTAVFCEKGRDEQ